MFLMSRKIKARGVKMVLSGEGADEIFGGYLYFHKAPNATYVGWPPSRPPSLPAPSTLALPCHRHD